MADSLIHAAAGAASGIVAMSITYPLIFISTRAAVETKKEQKSTYQAVLDIIKREGALGLYSGLSSSLLGIAVTNGVYYYFYERGRATILNSRSDGSKGLSTLESMLNGFIAGSATTITSNPIWVIQTQQAVQTMSTASKASVDQEDIVTPPEKLSFIQTAQRIIRKGGLGALWSGIGPALVLVINPILQYTVFEQLKNILVTRRASRLRVSRSAAAGSLLTDWDFFVLGALSKLVATTLTYPYIVLKSRLQAGSAQYSSALQGLKMVIEKEGIEGLYKGISSKLVQSVLTAAILFAGQKRIYELTKGALAPVLTK